ncbi:MAG TPA: tripartite tricarboxylate transporter substrate binding protein [Bradyrhizobium sp.]|uniref:Bug family tripartite tricarboxylate transporter substrate binding protein n=1 Tax=Bradyrhizobium sp. TaxID=376 RepID=UPI002C539BED|nr:tripartite tricarboxylate transporter substrate binding protein [Bradyrhizobium sp.]HLZ02735.1 tripartite tricarboxylate transporter substrate binding protein [Bradyrhizobium sp.]
MMRGNSILAAAFAAMALAGSPLAAYAQSGSSGIIRIVVPFAPAGSSDVLARVLQQPLQDELKQTIIIENRAGAGSNIGTSEVARARPDGLTLLLTSSAFVVNPALYKNVPYNFTRDFAPIALLPVAPNVFAVNPKQGGINALSDLIARAKADPQKLNYASPGNGTTPQLTMELFKLKTGASITNIPYNGGGPATQALMSGTVDVLSTALPGAQAQIRAGTMKGIALTTAERWPNLPDVPTFKELGYPDIDLNTEHFFLAPAGTPPEVIDRLSKATLAVLARDDIKKRVVALGYLPKADGPDAAKARIAKDVAFYTDLIARAKIPQIQ